MGKKFSDLEDKEKEKIRDQVNSHAKVFGADDYEDMSLPLQDADRYGECKNCYNFQYVRTEFRFVFARCSETKMVLSGKDRVVECTMFTSKNSMSLRDMENIAWLVDPTGRQGVGFVNQAHSRKLKAQKEKKKNEKNNNIDNSDTV